LRLADFSGIWYELADVGLDVEHGRAVDGVEGFDFYRQAANFQQLADGNSQAVGTILLALGEDSYDWPVRISARVSGATQGSLFLNPVEVEYDYQVRKISQAAQGFGAELGVVQFDG